LSEYGRFSPFQAWMHGFFFKKIIVHEVYIRA